MLLLIVFGTVVAALLPLGVGILAVIGGLGGVFLLARVTECLAVRAEHRHADRPRRGLRLLALHRQPLPRRVGGRRDVRGGLARALATAGRAIAFSGLTVAIGLSGLLFYQGTFLASMGMAGAIGVAFAVVYALTFLPALLAVLGPRVNPGGCPFIARPRRVAASGIASPLA